MNSNLARRMLQLGMTVVALLGAGVLQAESAGLHAGEVAAADIERTVKWGTPQPVVAVDGFHFSGQPDAPGFQQAAAAGVTHVVNLRGPQEVDWDVAAAVQAAGMTYHNLPLTFDNKGLNATSASRISALVDSLAGEKILVHCASGNRVAVWWATHLVSAHQLDASQAVNLAKQAGMKAELEPLLRAALQ